MLNSSIKKTRGKNKQLSAAEICFVLSNPVNHFTSHDPSDLKHHACRLQGHSLVTQGCNSQYEGEEEDGAYDGPDDDVGSGDT